MSDQVIDRATAAGLLADACRDHPLAGFVVVCDQPGPGEFIARLVTHAPTSYILRARTLADLRAQLPLGLQHSERQSVAPPDLVEIWFVR